MEAASELEPEPEPELELELEPEPHAPPVTLALSRTHCQTSATAAHKRGGHGHRPIGMATPASGAGRRQMTRSKKNSHGGSARRDVDEIDDADGELNAHFC